MHASLRIALSATLLSSLFACGGGGGGATADSPLSGKFVDAAVAGLTYTTETQSGTTDASGLFKYKSGETVTFKLYGQQISAAAGYTTLTPFDTSDTTLSADYSINLIRFLMALDTDSNPSNGIMLPTFNGSFNVNFNQDLFAFERDATVASFLTSYAEGRSLATVQNAITHFTSSIANANDNYTFNFNGKTATSTLTSSKCTNNLALEMHYSFGLTSVEMVGSDTFITNGNTICTSNAPETFSISYSSLAAGEFFDCAPNCSYAQLNRVAYVPSDFDGKTVIVWTWHTPNTKVITQVTRVIADPANHNNPQALSTLKEVLIFN